jgi:outer membrane protein OmpA-like peptidoglycan-associated protein
MNTRWPVQRWVPCTFRLASPIIPNWNISVEGYAGRRGMLMPNRKLSEDRANAVLN